MEMKRKYVVAEVMAAFKGIPNLPQKETLSLKDIQSSLPNVLTGTAYEADAYEVSFLGYFKTKAIAFVNTLEDKKFSFSPIAAYTYYGLFEINKVRILVSFRASQTAVIFVVKLQEYLNGVTEGVVFDRHELTGNRCIMVKRTILAQ